MARRSPDADRRRWRFPRRGTRRPPELVLTDEQQHAVDSLGPDAGTGRFSVALLQGVTGSGKTEIYLTLARAAVARHRQALILVPEIALTPAVATRFPPRLRRPGGRATQRSV